MNREQDWRYRRNCQVPEGKSLPPGIFRYAAGIEYDGSGYCGWQRQHHCIGVQQVLEAALSSVAAESLTVGCAGRTDTGVHATAQVIHFDTMAIRSPDNWLRGCNANLSRDVRCLWVREVPAGFHARFGALARTYRYIVLNTQSRPALLRQHLTWEKQKLSIAAMREAAAVLQGEQDFSSFRAAGCQSSTSWRQVFYIDIFPVNDMVVFEICANAFLLHMVRNIVGALLCVGRGEQPPVWLAELLAARDRSRAPATAPATGLYLVAVDYPSAFHLPECKPGPSFVARDFGGGDDRHDNIQAWQRKARVH